MKRDRKFLRKQEARVWVERKIWELASYVVVSKLYAVSELCGSW